LLLIGGANLSVFAESLECANLNGILQTNILGVIKRLRKGKNYREQSECCQQRVMAHGDSICGVGAL
jgi:hypothetical protein